MLTRLAAVDAVSLHTQTSTTPAHTVALIIVEPSQQLSHERLHRLVASSLPQLARFRSRLVSKPLGMGQPVWVEIDDYDPTSQIHCAAVRAPGGRLELAKLVAELSVERQGRRQPLWKAWSIEGLAGGRWALAVKMSPILSYPGDGAASIWPRLLTSGPHDDAAHNLPIEPSLGPAPSLGELYTDVVSEIFENQLTGAWLMAEAATSGLQALRRRLRATNRPDPIPSAASSMRRPVPPTMFNAPLTQRRAVAFASIPLTDVEAVSTAFGGNTANVLLAACTISLRKWLQQHDVVPDNPLLMRVPLSEPAGDPALSGNALGAGLIRLPVQLEDPVQVLTDLHTASERLSGASRHDAETTDADFATVVSLFPPSVTNRGMQLYARLRLGRWFAPACLGSVTYISQNAAPAYCAGAKVVGMHTAAPLLDGCGLNVAVTSHNDVMDLCMCVCPDNVPEVDAIATGIADAVKLLLAAAHESPRGHGRSVVTEMTSHVEKRSHARRHRGRR